jgi:hypothetical protein
MLKVVPFGSDPLNRVDGRARWQCGRDETGSMGRKEGSGANFSHAAGRAGAFFTWDWIGDR